MGSQIDCCYETNNVDEALKIRSIIYKSIPVCERSNHVSAKINVVPETLEEFDALNHEKELRSNIVERPYDFELRKYRKANKDEIEKNKEILKQFKYTRKIKDTFLI